MRLLQIAARRFIVSLALVIPVLHADMLAAQCEPQPSEPANATGDNVLPELDADDHASGNNLSNEFDASPRPSSCIPLPRLQDYYGGIFGTECHGDTFDFGGEFFTVFQARLRLTIETYAWIQQVAVAVNSALPPLVVDFRKPGWIILPLWEGVLEGHGTMTLCVRPGCCDNQAWVTEALICLIGIPMLASLAGFADFQNCFTHEGDTASEGCSAFDYDSDGDVDLADYDSWHAWELPP